MSDAPMPGTRNTEEAEEARSPVSHQWLIAILLVAFYYADATTISVSYADSATTLRYLESKKVDYRVPDSLNIRNMPTMGAGFAKGVPDPRAHLVLESWQGTKDRIKIYRWYGNSAPGVLASSQSVKE